MKLLLLLLVLFTNTVLSQTYVIEQYKNEYDVYYTNINSGYNYLHIKNDSLFIDVDLHGETILISGKIFKSKLTHIKCGKIYKYKVENKFYPKKVNINVYIIDGNVSIEIYKHFSRFEDIKFEARIADKKDIKRLKL